jgi:hypothetical protein
MQKIKSRESRRKLRRWSFIAIVTHPPVDKEGKPVMIVNEKTGESSPAPTPDPVTRVQRGRKVKDIFNGPMFELRSITVGASGDANNAALSIQREMREQLLKDNAGAKVVVVPVPHETVSPAMLQQVQGLKDHNDILQLAFELAVRETLDPEITADMENYDQSVKESKDKFYKQAMDRLRPPKTQEERLAELESEPVPGSGDVDAGQPTGESSADHTA